MQEIDLKDILPTLDKYSDALTGLLAGQEQNLPDALYIQFSRAASIAQLRKLVRSKSCSIEGGAAREFLSAVLARSIVLDPKGNHRKSILDAIASSAQHTSPELYTLAVQARRDHNIL